MAARSESAAASARWPMSRAASCVVRKCTPSTIASTEVTQYPSALTTAASSPSQRTTRGLRRSNAVSSAPISSSSRIAGGAIGGDLPVPVDDPGPVEVVWRELDAHPIPRQDADTEPAHLSSDVAEHGAVHVVELDAEHGVRQGLYDLAFQL